MNKMSMNNFRQTPARLVFGFVIRSAAIASGLVGFSLKNRCLS